MPPSSLALVTSRSADSLLGTSREVLHRLQDMPSELTAQCEISSARGPESLSLWKMMRCSDANYIS